MSLHENAHDGGVDQPHVNTESPVSAGTNEINFGFSLQCTPASLTPQQEAMLDILRSRFCGVIDSFGVDDGTGFRIERNVRLDHQELLRGHVAGAKRIALSPFTDDRTTVLWGCVDFDNHGNHAVPDPLGAGQKLRAVLSEKYGMSAYLERTFRDGAHVFLFFSPAASGAAVRRFLKQALWDNGFPEAEVFPKQDDLLPKHGKSEPQTGNVLNLPFWGGDGGVSDSRTVFLDPQGSIMPPPFTFETVSPGLLSQHLAAASAIPSIPATRASFPTPELKEGLEVVRTNCRFMRFIEEHGTNVSETLWEAYVSVCCTFEGGEACIHEFSSQYRPPAGTPGYTPELTDRKISRSSAPYRCYTIRKHGFTGCPEGGCGVRNPAALAVTDASTNSEAADKKQNPREQMLKDLVKNSEGLRDETGRSYVKFPGTPRILVRIESEAFNSYLHSLAVEKLDRPLNDRELREAQDMFKALAYRSGRITPVHLRKAEVNGEIHIDLGQPEWNQVVISSGNWTTKQTHDLPFRRFNRQQALPTPERGGSVMLLQDFINCSAEAFKLLVLWLLGCLGPKMPYPLLILKGEQGSAKTTTARLLSELVDPCHCAIRSMPASERDLAVAAQNSHLLVFDNLSGMSRSMSDALCRLSTGGSFNVRKLYSDEEEIAITLHSPVILTGISNVGEKEDLLDRSLIVTMRAIPEESRRTERELQSAFDEVKPRILGALYDVVAAGLARLSEVKLARMPRMADFARFATACEAALGWEAGTACRLLLSIRDEAMTDAIGENPFAIAVIEVALGSNGVTKTPAEWYNLFCQRFQEEARRAGWPKGPKVFSQQISEIAPLLRKLGIEIDRRRDSSSRQIMFRVAADSRELAKQRGILDW